MRTPRALGLVLLLLSSTVATAEDAVVDVVRVETPPAVDGRLDEPLWTAATLIDQFLARQPVEGATPSTRTEVRQIYTRRALYVGLRAIAADPRTIRATTVRRDDFAVMENDQFALAIDSFRDLRNGYWFSTNPMGARVDAQFSDEGARFEDSWNGVWSAAAGRQASRKRPAATAPSKLTGRVGSETTATPASQRS